MNEREICKQIIDFSLIAKTQLQSKETDLIKSILTVLIMEAEDLVEDFDEIALQQRQNKRAHTTG